MQYSLSIAKSLLSVALLISLLISCNNNQKNTIEVSSVKSGNNLSFPIISCSNTNVRENINVTLQLLELGIIKGHEQKDIFELLTNKEKRSHDTLKRMSYQILANETNNISILINRYSCFMGCIENLHYYNFNPLNGDRYFVHDFFDEEYFTEFKQIITKKRIDNIQNQIAKIEKLGIKTGYLKSMVNSQIERDDLMDFYFKNDSIYFNAFNSINTIDRYLPINFLVAIPISGFEHLLNEYGTAVLKPGANLNFYRAGREPQLYHGLIDSKIPFNFIFYPDDEGNLIGYYALKENGKAHRVDGKFKNNQLEFTEFWPSLEIVDKFHITVTKDKLSGYFFDNNSKKLPFEAIRK